MRISVPTVLKAWVELQAARGHYADADECVEEALRRARMVHTREEMEALALEGLRSGPGRAMSSGDWEAMKTEVRRRALARSPRRKSA